MATVIKLKRGTGTPTTSDLVSGEVAIDTSSQKFYINDTGVIKEIGGAAAAGNGTLVDLTDTNFTTQLPSQILNYNGSEWKNDFQHNVGKRVPFTKTDGTETTLALVNNKDMTTVNGFLDHVVVQSYYLPFTTANGTSIQTIRPGHMPTMEGI
jgi:archaellum component FlaG (FlaF/FlaG flagellin family)